MPTSIEHCRLLRELSALVGRELKFFAYPFGGKGHFNDISRRILEEAPGLVAFNTARRLNHTLDRTNVNRITLSCQSPRAVKIAVLEAQAPLA